MANIPRLKSMGLYNYVVNEDRDEIAKRHRFGQWHWLSKSVVCVM